jgi:tRNA_anti-like
MDRRTVIALSIRRGASMSEASSPPPAASTSGLGIAALVIGLVGLIIGLVPCVGWFVGVPLGAIGLLLGLIALATAGSATGKGLPVTGTIISVLAIVLSWYSTHIWVMLGIGAAEGAAKAAQDALKKQVDELKSKAKAGPSVTATELLKAYKDDAKKADEKYKGKWLTVKGTVEDAAVSSTTLKSDDKDVPGTVKVIRSGLTVLGDSSKLTKGSEVTFGGKCGGKTGPDVTIEEAVLMD